MDRKTTLKQIEMFERALADARKRDDGSVLARAMIKAVQSQLTDLRIDAALPPGRMDPQVLCDVAFDWRVPTSDVRCVLSGTSDVEWSLDDDELDM